MTLLLLDAREVIYANFTALSFSLLYDNMQMSTVTVRPSVLVIFTSILNGISWRPVRIGND